MRAMSPVRPTQPPARTPTLSRPRHRPSRAVAAAGLILLAVGGCQKPLFSPEEDRSPFDRFDAMRNQQAPQVVEDEYGRKQPNLRARLLPKN